MGGNMKDFVVIYAILNALRDSMDADDFDLNTIAPEKLDVSENRWKFLIQMLDEEGYVKDLTVRISVDRRITFLPGPRPRITLKGLEYLEDNSMMKKAYNLLKEAGGIIQNVSQFAPLAVKLME